MHSTETVIIVGAGIGGLTLARALELAGIRYEVYERAAELHPVGAGIVMQTSAMCALRRLGIADAVVQAGRELLLGTGRTPSGTILQTTDMGFLKEAVGAPTIAIHRARLHRVLLESLNQERVHVGHGFTHFEQDTDGASAHFENGKTARGTLLVGADGLHSRVREAVVGKTPLRYAGYTSWRGVVASRSALVGPNEVTELWGCGLRFGIVPIGADLTYWFAVANAPEGESDSDPRGTVLAHFKAWPSAVTDIVAATPGTQVLRTDIHDRKPIATWSKGRATLLGDAAHPTTPNLGQGGCMAVEDAVVLAHKLTKGDWDAALGAYERLRVAPTSRIVDASWRFGAVAQWSGRVSTWIRDMAMRATPASVIQKQLLKNARFVLDELPGQARSLGEILPPEPRPP